MFHACEFTFAEESSAMYGLVVCDIDGNGQSDVNFGNKANIIESTTRKRLDSIHLGVDYNTTPLEFKLVFGSERALDRYEMAVIAMWLTGHQEYQWLTIDQEDLAHIEFKCLITSLVPITVGWLPYAFEATVRCDSPYAYSLPFSQSFPISGTTSVLFRNHSSVREYLKPELLFLKSSGVTTLRIVNQSDGGREFSISSVPTASGQVYVDNHNGIIQDVIGGVNLYGGFNMNFFRLVQGDNLLTVTGNGTLTISGRFIHNMAG